MWAWDVCYIIFCRLLDMHSGNTGIMISLSLRSLWWVQIVRYVLACTSYSFISTLYHRIVIIVQTYLNLWNASQIYFLECMSKIKHILSVIHYTIYGVVCFTVYPEVWTIIHCLGSGHETMLCAVCLSIFLQDNEFSEKVLCLMPTWNICEIVKSILFR